jgi:hypothetical protein
VKQQQPALTSVLRDGERQLRAQHGERVVGGVGETDLVVYRPFWNATTQTVDVYFGYRKSGGVRVKTPPRRNDQHTKGMSKELPAPAVVVTRSVAAVGARYRIGAGGRVTEVETFAPMSLERRRVPWEDERGRVASDAPPPPAFERRGDTIEHTEPCEPATCGPKPRLPTERCSDGSVGGFTGRCLRKASGRCGWEIKRCSR